MELHSHADEVGETPHAEDLAEALLELFERLERIPDQRLAPFGQPDMNGPAIGFVRAAREKRGVVAWVEKAGEIRLADEVAVHLPPLRVYPHPG